LQNLFETMQVYLGSLYVNDFNRFGRTYQVIAQADAPFRDRVEDITRLKTRNAEGQMVPLGTLVKVKEAYGPDRVMRLRTRRRHQRRRQAYLARRKNHRELAAKRCRGVSSSNGPISRIRRFSRATRPT
jgi:Cu/Ag efflux pump CusA